MDTQTLQVQTEADGAVSGLAIAVAVRKVLDQIRDGERCGALVGATGSGGAERAALPAGEPRDEPLAVYCEQLLDIRVADHHVPLFRGAAVPVPQVMGRPHVDSARG